MKLTHQNVSNIFSVGPTIAITTRVLIRISDTKCFNSYIKQVKHLKYVQNDQGGKTGDLKRYQKMEGP